MPFMNSFTIILLAFAVALTVFPSCLTGGVVLKKEKTGSKMRFIAVMAVTLVLMTLLGIVLGMNVGRISESANKVMALSILLIVGLKVFLDSLRTRPQDKAFDTSEFKVLVLMSLAESIIPMAVAIAIGLQVESFLKPWLIFTSFILVTVIAGFVAGNKMGVQAFKMRTGPIGGLFLIAASLIMIIDLIGY
jgi:putative Mn2+ efflux pump MntP